MTRGARRAVSRSTWLKLALGALVLAIIIALLLDWRRIQPVLRQADWLQVLVAIGFAFLSLIGSGLAFAVVNRVFGLPTPAQKLFQVGFVNMSVNNLVTLGGAAGMSVSALLLKQKDTELRDVLAASVFNSYLYFLIGSTLLPFSLLYLLLNQELPGWAQPRVMVVTVVASLLAIAVHVAVWRSSVRRVVLSFAGRMWHRVTRRNAAEALERFGSSFAQGLSLLRARPGRVFALLGFLVWDWVCCLVSLWLCFAALGNAPGPGVLFSGFFVAIAIGAASMIPGGLGVQDGSMAGIYALLGMRLDKAVLASVLFRVVYYFLPFLVGLVLYWRLMRSAGDPVQEPGDRIKAGTAERQ